MTFVSERQLLDGVVVVSELIRLRKRRTNECMLLKLHFDKAYDSVN